MTSSLLRCRFATLGARLVKVNKSDVVECKIKKSLDSIKETKAGAQWSIFLYVYSFLYSIIKSKNILEEYSRKNS